MEESGVMIASVEAQSNYHTVAFTAVFVTMLFPLVLTIVLSVLLLIVLLVSSSLSYLGQILITNKGIKGSSVLPKKSLKIPKG
jgi:MFS superfamily sulfate permease-like transporter